MSIRIATRAIITQDSRLLLVNAFPIGDGEKSGSPHWRQTPCNSDLWCAPGGGAKAHSSLPDNLAREVHEETGLTIRVGAPCLINEFHNPDTGFHQVEVFFRCTVTKGVLSADWQDPEQIVQSRRFFTRDQMENIRFKPDSLPDVAFNRGMGYDRLETLVK